MFIVPGRTELILLSWFICLVRMFYSSIGVQWGPGVKPRQGASVPQKLEHFLKYTAWNLRPGENERHNLMPLMA